MSEEQAVIKGKLIHIVYRSDNRYTVARFKLYDLTEKNIVVTGYLPEMEKDVIYELQGNYMEHPKYGMQFNALTVKRQLPSDSDSVIAYLSGPLFPGIGKKTAEEIVEKLGDDCLERIKADPMLLEGISKLNEKKRKSIINGINTQDDLQEAIAFFSTHGLGIRNIMRLDAIYGKEALAKVKENPYRLVEEVDGIGFKTADKLAMNMGFSLDDERRLKAGVLSLVLEECVKSGDSYITYDQLENKAFREFGDLIQFDTILDELLEKQLLYAEDARIYHHTQYKAEKYISAYLNTPLEELYGDFTDQDLTEHLGQFEEEIGIAYDGKQREAIFTFFHSDIMILTGGPGTGKTTVVRAMVELFRRIYPYYSISVCAPTGRAAKRLTELTGAPASTIHRLLKWDLETNTFGYNINDPLLSDLVIIDEASMVDQWMFYNLLSAGRNFKKILIIGDEDQLPSVGIGAILRDLIESRRFPLVALDRVFRQKEGSAVIELAHKIKNDEEITFDYTKEVLFIDADPYAAKSYILQLVNNAIDKGYDINDIQVLSPIYSGVCGIDSLNNYLQKALNPADSHKRELQVGFRTFREGDKILQLKNQPDDDVYNGDIGILREIVYANEEDNKTNLIIVDFDGIIVEYTPDYFVNITHAYCISVHKAQGSEYPIILMPVLKSNYFMLSKKLLYTAVSRATKSLILLGEKDAFYRGVATREHHERLTTLKERILEDSLEIPQDFFLHE